MELDLYSYHADGGRDGDLFGIFIAPVGHPERLVNDKLSVRWGDVLGRGSGVIDHLDEFSFERHNISAELIQQMIGELNLVVNYAWPGVYSINGYNPFTELSNDE